MILALTEGLPESYSTFIITLDSLPADELTLNTVISCLLNGEVCQNQAKSELQWQIPRGWLEWCLDQRDLVSIYVLCPSSLLVANLKPEGLEVLEYIGMSDKRIC